MTPRPITDNDLAYWGVDTWNPVTGCDRCSPGCDNCYALALAARLKRMGAANYQTDGNPRTSGPGFGVQCHPEMLAQPLRWARPRRIFVNSMSDLFHPDVPDEFIAQVFAVMACAPRHTFQVLTKRPQRMEHLLNQTTHRHGFREARELWIDRLVDGRLGRLRFTEADDLFAWPLPNVWLGVSIESDRYAFRADYLRNTPAAVRFISAEPLLGSLSSLDVTGFDWLVVGGESGPHARPMHPAWVRDLRDRSGRWRCGRYDQRVGPAFFFKQWGEWVPYEPDPQPPFWGSQHGDLVDGHHLPADLTEPGVHGGWLADDDVEIPVVYRRVGKKAAGRLLDGRTWGEFPGGGQA